MLNEYAGYSLGVLCAIIGVTIYIRRSKNKRYVTSRAIMFITLVYFFTVLMTNNFFPMPIYCSVIKSDFHEVQNYYIPFENIFITYKDYVINGDLALRTFIKYNIAKVVLYLMNIVPIGILTKALYQIKFKKFVLYSVAFSFTFELFKLCIGKIIGVNYISLSSEYVLYSFVGLLCGYKIYYIILHFSKKFSDKSNILHGINQLLFYMSGDEID